MRTERRGRCEFPAVSLQTSGARRVLGGSETEEIESIDPLREEVDEDGDDPENCEACGHRRNERGAGRESGEGEDDRLLVRRHRGGPGARGEGDAPISTAMSAMTICSRRSAWREVTVSLRSWSMSWRTSTRELSRSTRCGISR